jgi:transposase
MQLKTILNRVEPFKSFVYGNVRWGEEAGRPMIEVELHARKNGRAICSGCDRPSPGYDRLPQRRFEFVPLWGMAVFFLYAMRRVDCPSCGVTVELSELLQYNLQSVRSHLLREDFQRFWEYTTPGWAVKFLDQWCTRTMRSKIEPMKKIARSLREHRALILNWFRAKGTVSAGSVEGLNLGR